MWQVKWLLKQWCYWYYWTILNVHKYHINIDYIICVVHNILPHFAETLIQSCLAGSGVHFPSLVQTEVIVWLGVKPSVQRNFIVDPSSVVVYDVRRGRECAENEGILQFTAKTLAVWNHVRDLVSSTHSIPEHSNKLVLGLHLPFLVQLATILSLGSSPGWQ